MRLPRPKLSGITTVALKSKVPKYHVSTQNIPKPQFYSIIFHSILFYSVLFYFILLYFLIQNPVDTLPSSSLDPDILVPRPSLKGITEKKLWDAYVYVVLWVMGANARSFEKSLFFSALRSKRTCTCCQTSDRNWTSRDPKSWSKA